MSRAKRRAHFSPRRWQNLKIFAVCYLIFPLLQLLSRSWRIKLGLEQYPAQSMERFKAKDYFKTKPTILALWHHHLLIVGLILARYWHLPVTAVISKSHDGQLLTKLAHRFGHIEVIEVAHDAKDKALVAMHQALKRGRMVVITPDGPKGPWEKVKLGLALTAKKCAARIVTFRSKGASWKLPSPDQMRLPKLGTTLEILLEEVPFTKETNIREIGALCEERLSDRAPEQS